MSKKFQVKILGVNSAMPVHGRHPSSQIVDYDGTLCMIDCGEGTQAQISKYKIKRNHISHIFISHMHGDHCYGLPGLITSLALGGRSKPLHLHGPVGLKRFIETILEVSEAYLPYPHTIIEYDTEISHQISINPYLTVHTFPMKHRIPTMGFRFQEVNVERNIDSSKIKEYQLSIEEIKAIKNGGDIERNGNVIVNEALILAQKAPRSYVYCSDTVYDKELIPYISGASLLYHETTYLDDLEELASQRMHATLGQAISIANSAQILSLITGHYSSRYVNLQVFFDQGIDRFPGLLLGTEGSVYRIESADLVEVDCFSQ